MCRVWAFVGVLVGCDYAARDVPAVDGDPSAPDADPSAPDAMPGAPDAMPGAPDAAPRVYLFADGFETGLDPWSDVTLESGDSATVSSAQAHAGVMSGRCATNSTPEAQAAFYKNLAPMTEVHARFHVRLDPSFNNGSYVGLLSFVHHAGGWNNIATATLGSDKQIFVENNAGGGSIDPTTPSPITLTSGAWHVIEMSATISPSAGSLIVRVDGAIQVQATGIDTGTLPVNRLAFGIIWEGQGSQALGLHVDDVIIDPLPL
jgi:hypothetical protein